MSTIPCTVAVLLLLTTMRSAAHHAFAAEYDENKIITISGTVTKFKWINPHAWLYVVGQDESNVANARTVILPDGRQLFSGFQSTPWLR